MLVMTPTSFKYGIHDFCMHSAIYILHLMMMTTTATLYD